jgi:hypothetical protein
VGVAARGGFGASLGLRLGVVMTEQHRAMAAEFFNAVWGLLDKDGRSRDDDLQMIHMAHASRAHWQVAGGAREWAIGEWQISRVYAVLRQPGPALYHAEAALALTEGEAVGAFLAGCAYEVMARACRIAGRISAADRHRAKAAAIAETLTDAEERDLLLADLAQAG